MKIEKIKIRGIGKINITGANEDSYEIIAEERIKKHIKVKEEEGLLAIDTKNPLLGLSALFKKKEIIINIKSKNISKIDLGGDLKGEIEKINEEDLIINTSGSVKMKVKDAFIAKLKISINGNGTMHFDGSGEELIGDINGNGSVEAREFKVKKAKISIAGHGKVNLYCAQELDGTILGAGSINYLGEGKVISSNLLGVGKISKL